MRGCIGALRSYFYWGAVPALPDCPEHQATGQVFHLCTLVPRKNLKDQNPRRSKLRLKDGPQLSQDISSHKGGRAAGNY